MAQKSEFPLWLHDFAACIGLLTRLPVRVDTGLAMTRSSVATWAYPLVGCLLGGLAYCLVLLFQLLGLVPLVSLVLVVAVQIVLTGAMHEDGLADSADGLWGGWTVERRLEIMKDSSIGVYGVCAVVVILILKLTTLASLVPGPLLALGLIGGAALSRAAMVVLLYVLPPARGGGLGQSVGKPPLRSVWIAIGVACGGALLLGLVLGHIWSAVLMILITGLMAWACARIAQRKINGFTGDILGATQQVCDVAAIIALAAVAY